MTGKPVRSDARENRRRILEVARDAFAQSGDTSLNEIAKRAGVGPGTLYRHFPTRESLVLVVYRHEIEDLAALAPALLGTHPPLEALRLWLDRVARYGQLKYGAAEVIHAATTAGMEDETYALVIAAIKQLLAAGSDAELLRPDIDPDDFLLLISFLWRIDPATGGEARAARMLDLVMEGLLARD
ncbi:purine salvage operon transcriptional regulator XdhR [Actinoallomurus bryophytorum]|uniref:TetR family transcriptional regulator n=1 Tax=Actinoallomurus bryophytorum TaxID=1490222 RepID=A0A543CCT9_9ACTN|nr:TetR/AcrR family transcriptional regulator [Actinoallomurus bryophytorum]TQL94916.1 TetR family transcriptional regulator [Actinoallomurus bryophytorum]